MRERHFFDRQDAVRVLIEDVNLSALPSATAMGRDLHGMGLLAIDLTQGVGNRIIYPHVGETWWIQRRTGRWHLMHIVDGGAGTSTGTHFPGIPGNVALQIDVIEQKAALEYKGIATWTSISTDSDGLPITVVAYIVEIAPCDSIGNIITGEDPRQQIMYPANPDDGGRDPDFNLHAVWDKLPNPKIWYWEARVRALDDVGTKGPWSNWTTPLLPFRDALPKPPVPGNVSQAFSVRETKTHLEFRGEVSFDDVGYWDIPGFDFQDDISFYEVQEQPLQRNDSTGTIIPGDGHKYDYPTDVHLKRKTVHDKDEAPDNTSTQDTLVTRGTLTNNISDIQTQFDVTESSTPTATPFTILIDSEKMIVVGRIADGSNWQYTVKRGFQNTTQTTHTATTTVSQISLHRYKAIFDALEKPRTYYWRSRVRAVDRFNRRGDWSIWTLPGLPWTGSDPQPPTPTNITVDYTIREFKTHPEYRALVRFDDAAPNGWDVPGGDHEDDLDHYWVQLQPLIRDDVLGYINGGDAHLYTRPTKVLGTLAANITTTIATSITVNESLNPSTTNIPPTPFLMMIDAEMVNVINITGGGPKTYTVVRGVDGTTAATHTSGVNVGQVVGVIRRREIHDKDEDNSGVGAYTYIAHFGTVPHPRLWYWRTRARSYDRFNRPGAWSSWTLPSLPFNDPDLIVPAPTGLALSFDRVERDRYTRYRAIATWNEVNFTLPDGDTESDVAKYAVQLQANDGDVLAANIASTGATSISVTEVYAAPSTPFVIYIDDEALNVTARSGSNNPFTYTVTRGYQNTTAATHSSSARLWKAPGRSHFVSAKQDADTNTTAQAIFAGIRFTNVFRSRVRTLDRFNRRSNWSSWTSATSPSAATAPSAPVGMILDVDQHKVHLWWDQATDPADSETPAAGQDAVLVPHIDVAFYQAQIAGRSDYRGAQSVSSVSFNNTTKVATITANAHGFSNNDLVRTVSISPAVYNGIWRVTNTATNTFDIQMSSDQTSPGAGGAGSVSSILWQDRSITGHSRTWKMRRHGNNTIYGRVRAVDAIGNRSTFTTITGLMNGVPTPAAPTIAYDISEENHKLRAVVTFTSVLFADDDIVEYAVQLQPASVVTTTGAINNSSNPVTFGVSSATNLASAADATHASTIYIDDEQLLITGVAGSNITASRAQGGTTIHAHNTGTKVYFFLPSGTRRHQMVREPSDSQNPDPDDPLKAIFNAIRPRHWFRARVRATDKMGRQGAWSSWS